MFKIALMELPLQDQTMSTHITNASTMGYIHNHDNHYRYEYGIALFGSSYTQFDNIVTINAGRGMELTRSTHTQLSNIVATNNSDGIHIHTLNQTNITNVVVENNVYGINSYFTINTHVTCVTANYNQHGIFIYNVLQNYTKNTQIMNITVNNNTGNGLIMGGSYNTSIYNANIAYNGHIGMRLYNMTNTTINNSSVMHNKINGIILERTYFTNISNLLVYDNMKHPGIAIFNFAAILILDSHFTLIVNTSFTNYDAPNSAKTEEINTQPSIIRLYSSSLILNGCKFTKNHITAIWAQKSNVTFLGEVIFSNNTAYTGSALILTQDSILNVVENSLVIFSDNRVTFTGGVFVVSAGVTYHVKYYFPHGGLYGDTIYSLRSVCFIHTEGNKNQPHFIFSNNSAGIGGDILYGVQGVLASEERRNCLDSFKRISNISERGLSLISSDPSRVCICNPAGIPNCTILVDSTLPSIYPGQTISVSVVVVGQEYGTVSGSVYAQFLLDSPDDKDAANLGTSQTIQTVGQYSCNILNYTIYSNLSEIVLVLTVHKRPSTYFDEKTLTLWEDFYHISENKNPLLYTDIPVFLKIFINPCPLAFDLTNEIPFRCDCSKLLQKTPRVQCFIQENRVERSGLIWVGTTDNKYGSNGTVAISDYCPLNYCTKEGSNITLSDPDSQCNYNHSGILCGGCQPGLSLTLGSAQCMECSNQFLPLLIPFAVAGPALVGFIKLFDLTVSQGAVNGLIFYANIIQANQDIFLPWKGTHPMVVFIAWLNLDLGVETCFFDGLDAYLKTWLQFVFPLYIWSIAGLIIIVARYSDKFAKYMGNKSVPILATLILFSYAKLFRNIITALSKSTLHMPHGSKAVWSADGNVDYLGSKHTPLFVTAVMLLFFVWLPYTLLLFLGRWLHKCNSRLINKLLIMMKPFLDAHYGPLKDKHHYWFGALQIVRAIILLISALIPSDHSSIVAVSILVACVLLMPLSCMVYQVTAVSIFEVFFFMNLALTTVANLYTMIESNDKYEAPYILIGFAFLQFIAIVVFQTFNFAPKSFKLNQCMFWRAKGCNEDDWELYEQAALLREVESDTEENNSDDSVSMDSLPTY